MMELDPDAIGSWLEKPPGKSIRFPDVAQGIVDWLIKGDYSDPQALADSLWDAAQPRNPQRSGPT